MPRFDVRFNGVFYSYALLDRQGREVHALSEACDLAESMCGSDWSEVYNGDAGTSRDEYLDAASHSACVLCNSDPCQCEIGGEA
jgi:hypothetical protein